MQTRVSKAVCHGEGMDGRTYERGPLITLIRSCIVARLPTDMSG